MKLTLTETSRLCRSLALLLHAGLPLAGGLYLMAEEEVGEVRALLETMGQTMDEGGDLCTAMAAADAFPPLVVGMVRAGEASGRLERALDYLAAYYDTQAAAARQLKQAVAYPCMLLALMVLVIGVLLTEVLPVFDRVYANLGSGLTGVAGVLLRLGMGLKAALPGILVALVVLAAVAGVCAVYGPARAQVKARFLALFGDQGVLRQFNNAQFARGLAMGLGSGLPMDEAMELAVGLVAHIPGAAGRCGACRSLLTEEGDLPRALQASGLLPAGEARMLALGLQSGSGDMVMEDIADRLSLRAGQSLEDAVARIEPAMVLVSALLVGVILLTVMLPLMDVLSYIG